MSTEEALVRSLVTVLRDIDSSLRRVADAMEKMNVDDWDHDDPDRQPDFTNKRKET